MPKTENTVRDHGRSESGTMYRPDALYQGSLANIPQFRSRADLSNSELSKYGSMRRNQGTSIEQVRIFFINP